MKVRIGYGLGTGTRLNDGGFAVVVDALERLRFDSVWLTSFFHANVNTHGLGIIPMYVIGVSPVLGGVTGVVGIVSFGALGVWLLAHAGDHGAHTPVAPAHDV